MEYRDKGAVGALLDEYEKANNELKKRIENLNNDQLSEIVDPITDDPDCRSIQTILTHVVRAGHCYVLGIREAQGESVQLPERELLDTADAYLAALDRMFDATEQVFEDYPDLVIEELDPAKKIKFSWGQAYDVEQLMEHAIVHILRHRRQIERFLLKMNS